MTINAEIRCDAYGCRNERNVSEDALVGYPDIDLPNGWHEHDGFHYCGVCWPDVKKEIGGDA